MKRRTHARIQKRQHAYRAVWWARYQRTMLPVALPDGVALMHSEVYYDLVAPARFNSPAPAACR